MEIDPEECTNYFSDVAHESDNDFDSVDLLGKII